jgi:hypothetical protein
MRLDRARPSLRRGHLSGNHPLKDAHAALDEAVRGAYGANGTGDPLAFLLDLNLTVAGNEAAGKAIVGPGLPKCATEPYVTSDCLAMPGASGPTTVAA